MQKLEERAFVHMILILKGDSMNFMNDPCKTVPVAVSLSMVHYYYLIQALGAQTALPVYFLAVHFL